MLAMTVDEPRLYSRQRVLPVDVIAEQHREVHADLERWGLWNAGRYKAASCNSVESRYREQTPRATGTGIEPRIMVMERAVLRMPREYRDTVRLFYVDKKSPEAICRMLVIRKVGFSVWMFTARAIVRNLVWRHGDGND